MFPRLISVFVLVLALLAQPAGAEPYPPYIRNLLERYAGEMFDAVALPVRAGVAKNVAGYPEPTDLDVPGFEWIERDGEWPEPVIRSRDWAFAREGLALSLAGALGDGKAALFDAGFWCFLYAALLAPDEPQHLVNVAFHLNVRGAYSEAEAVLRHALSLEPDLPGALNNLAFAEAAERRSVEAISTMWRAPATGTDPDHARARLAEYYRAIGQTAAAEKLENMAALGYVEAIDFEPETDAAAKTKQLFLDTWRTELFPLAGEISKRFPIEPFPWAPHWTLSEGEQSYLAKHCSVSGTCSRLGGISIGHYLVTDQFRGACRARQPQCEEGNTFEACEKAYCEVCVIDALDHYTRWDWAHRAEIIARTGQVAAFARNRIEEVRAQGHVLLGLQSDQLTGPEQTALRAYWDMGTESLASSYDYDLAQQLALPRLTLAQQIAYSEEAMACATGAAEAAAAEDDLNAKIAAREQAFQDWLARQPHGLCRARICSAWAIPLGPLTLEINPRTLEIEAFDVALGLYGVPELQAGLKFGWNLKKNQPKVSLGFTMPMAGFTRAGASIGWTPSTGFNGFVSTGGHFAGPENLHLLKAKSQFFHLGN